MDNRWHQALYRLRHLTLVTLILMPLHLQVLITLLYSHRLNPSRLMEMREPTMAASLRAGVAAGLQKNKMTPTDCHLREVQ
jgi:hypothetical protein